MLRGRGKQVILGRGVALWGHSLECLDVDGADERGPRGEVEMGRVLFCRGLGWPPCRVFVDCRGTVNGNTRYHAQPCSSASDRGPDPRLLLLAPALAPDAHIHDFHRPRSNKHLADATMTSLHSLPCTSEFILRQQLPIGHMSIQCSTASKLLTSPLAPTTLPSSPQHQSAAVRDAVVWILFKVQRPLRQP